MQRGAGAETSFAEVRKLESELPRHAREQLEVSRRKVECAAFDAAQRAAEHGIAAGTAKADTDLVREDFLGRAHFLDVSAFNTFWSCATRNWFEKTENCTRKARACVGLKSPCLNHAV